MFIIRLRICAPVVCITASNLLCVCMYWIWEITLRMTDMLMLTYSLALSISVFLNLCCTPLRINIRIQSKNRVREFSKNTSTTTTVAAITTQLANELSTYTMKYMPSIESTCLHSTEIYIYILRIRIYTYNIHAVEIWCEIAWSRYTHTTSQSASQPARQSTIWRIDKLNSIASRKLVGIWLIARHTNERALFLFLTHELNVLHQQPIWLQFLENAIS